MTTATTALLLSRLGRLNEALLQQICTPRSTTAAEFRVLAMLRHHAEDGPVSPTTIAEWIVQTSGGLTATLRRLEDRGWIVREDDPHDRRSRLVALTPEGRRLHDELFDDVVERYDSALSGVDAEAALATVRDLVAGFERAYGAQLTGGWQVDTGVHP